MAHKHEKKKEFSGSFIYLNSPKVRLIDIGEQGYYSTRDVLTDVSASSWVPTIYYVNEAEGDDDNAGTTHELAWKTLAKVNASEFNPGDRILLRCGDVWAGETLAPTCSGTEDRPLVFGCYGTGTLPHIYGSGTDANIQLSGGVHDIVIQDIGDPTYTSNYGYYGILCSTGSYNILVQRCIVPKSTLANVKVDGCWDIDFYMCELFSPGTTSGDGRNNVDIVDSVNILVRNCFMSGASHSPSVYLDSDSSTIRNCVIVGGGDEFIYIKDSGVNIYDNVLFYNPASDTSQIMIRVESEALSDISIDYNCYYIKNAEVRVTGGDTYTTITNHAAGAEWADWIAVYSTDENSFIEDPDFSTSPPTRITHCTIDSSSPCYGTGRDGENIGIW